MDLVFPTTGCFESVKSIKKILLVFPGPANCKTFEYGQNRSRIRNENFKLKLPDSHKDWLSEVVGFFIFFFKLLGFSYTSFQRKFCYIKVNSVASSNNPLARNHIKIVLFINDNGRHINRVTFLSLCTI